MQHFKINALIVFVDIKRFYYGNDEIILFIKLSIKLNTRKYLAYFVLNDKT